MNALELYLFSLPQLQKMLSTTRNSACPDTLLLLFVSLVGGRKFLQDQRGQCNDGHTLAMGMFRQHYIGSLIGYALFVGLSLTASLIVQLPLEWNPTIPVDLWKIGPCFIIAALSGTWPDVDIKSKSQQIFYRLFFVSNAVLILRGRYVESACLGIFAMVPLIGKHRGWTHSKLAMLLLPAAYLILPFYFHEIQIDFDNLLSTDNLQLIKIGLPFYTAGLIGYATHLHLDRVLIRSRKVPGRKKKRPRHRI